MTAIAIRTLNLSRNFGTVLALDNLSIEVPRGIVFGFLGANGSGKSTLARAILGQTAVLQGGEVSIAATMKAVYLDQTYQ
ncbi:MAG: ATP-binding cassette domain-containing protein, partial [Tolypothrix sp. T3-bin4]|nr:ATP-binding cassette domain-containing protein [Tolypothrix sp. T3-bin4]